MTTFAKPRTLPERITDALAALRVLREQGNKSDIASATSVMDELLDRYPRKPKVEAP